ncbi:MAG TPA: hypothetical protein VHW24_24460 [Bryobacteraceae bacterium]|jgi:hypothetical protein|nr:hypothetical protein [Bryobacteraceae bacterium]
MKDYTWQARSLERHYNSHGQIESKKQEVWETLILEGQPYRRMLERDGKPLNSDERSAEQKKLDREVDKLSKETPQQKQHRLEDAEKQRKQEFAFVSEIPALFNLHLEGEGTVDGHPVWIVSGTPKSGAKPKGHDAAVLLKVRGRLWIDKVTYQWVKVEGETIGVISWGVFLARLNPGAKLIFEQTQVSSDVWLPKRLFMTGSGRVALLKHLIEDQEIQWSNYRKFSVDSKIVGDQMP